MSKQAIYVLFGKYEIAGNQCADMIEPMTDKYCAYQRMLDQIEAGSHYDRYLIQEWRVDKEGSYLWATITYEMNGDSGHGWVADSYNWEFDGPNEVI